ncbi:DUF1217 domain-containing protein [Hyphomicrobium sp.]|uniref:DUF1217 domain-containing protein n=1 Tax=Hyphomicrobium sp. TaxID=82 RepID=UPI000FAD98E3|nr:DUF1217 domain-containing protein [Hyphomicrobium sp.]RUO99403.1 MAG: DUF1217 domain-containing protein [Hyphomicrobium sp.]
MTSTYLLYRTYAANLPQTLSRIGVQTDVANAATYYQNNIGNVTSVDDFLNNTRLFSYAMSAYGLSDMAYAKAFMKKVLTSDLTDKHSFVNKLTDPRFLAFAKAFQFSTDGTVAPQDVVPQTQTEEDDTIGLYSQTQVNKGAAASTEATYYQSQIGNITSVDQLMSNARLLKYVVTAYGLNPDRVSNATIRAVLTSDLSDPNSTANTLNNSAYQSLAAAFNFNTDGTVNGTAQSSANISKTVYQYYNATGTSATPAAAAYKTQYYKAAISSITSVDDLLNNNALRDVALTAFGLNPLLQSNTALRQILTSDLSDPNSVANQQTNAAYEKLAAAFNFNADGSVNGSAQTADQTNSVIGLYSNTYDDALQAANDRATTSYKSALAGVKTVDDLLKSTAYNFIMNAYGFDSSTMTKYTLKKILESDPNDPSSFARQSHNAAYIKLASDFNFDADGNSKTAPTAQTQNNIISTGALYTTHNGGVVADGATATLQQTAAQTETTYYATKMASITNVDDFLKDNRLVKYALDAYGLKTANLSTSDLRKILTSDPLDPKSFINQPENAAYRDLAVAYNFGTDGKTLSVPKQQVQDRSQRVATADGYLEQTMETQAGDQSDGLRLALYFLNKAPNITSPYQLLADKALLQFTQTALGLSTAMSQADIDTQAKMITKKLNLADLQDPTKLNKLITQFSAMYDINNSNVASTSPVVQILQGSSTSFNGIIDIGAITTPIASF